jgi:DNA-binding NarL/FixJ family response regulator
VIRGERYLDPLLKEVNTECERFDWNELNQREREILPLLARGFKNKDIAAELFIAETTARDYVSSILSKLKVSNRAAAAAWAIKNGLIGG